MKMLPSFLLPHRLLAASVITMFVSLMASPVSAEISREDALRFVRGYLNAAQQPTPDEEVSHYAPRVRYFDSGTVDQDFVAADQRRYYKLWPQRSFELMEEPEIVGDESDTVTLKFIIRYEVNNAERRATGLTQNTMRVQRFDDGLKIVSMSERKVNPRELSRRSSETQPAPESRISPSVREERPAAVAPPRPKAPDRVAAATPQAPEPKPQEPPAPRQPRPSTAPTGTAETPAQVNVSPAPMPTPASAPPGIAIPVPGSPGLVYLPGTEQTSKNMIDVRGYTPGQKVKDPRSGQIFVVP